MNLEDAETIMELQTKLIEQQSMEIMDLEVKLEQLLYKRNKK